MSRKPSLFLAVRWFLPWRGRRSTTERRSGLEPRRICRHCSGGRGEGLKAADVKADRAIWMPRLQTGKNKIALCESTITRAQEQE